MNRDFRILPFIPYSPYHCLWLESALPLDIEPLFFVVPEYEVTEPYQTNAEGEFVSNTLHERHTREVHDDSGEWHYKMDAFGNKMHLKLRKNKQLVKPGLELETRHDSGDVTKTPVSRDSYFHGKVSSDPGSFVAVSNTYGLVWSVKFFF